MPGYLLTQSDKTKLPAKYMCSFCDCLLRDAVQTSCGHFYCLPCLDSLTVNDSTIPSIKCRIDGECITRNEVFQDNFMRREIMSLIIHCPFVDFGCKWKGEVRHLETSHTKTCEFQQVSCIHPECGMLVKKSDLKQHLEKECKCRLHNCNYCKKDVKLNLMEVHHGNDCPGFPVVCQKCSNEIPRSEIEEHQNPVTGHCEGVKAPCPFSELGCPEKKIMSRSQRQQHVEKDMAPHISLLLKTAVNLSIDVESLMCRAPGLISRNPSFVADYENAISDILTRVQGVVGEHRELREKIQKHSERITVLERGMATLGTSGGTPAPVSAEASGPGLPVNELTRRATNLENRTADHEVLLVESNRNVDDLRQQINSLSRQFEAAQETIRRLERKVESHEHVLAIRNVALADLEEFVRQQQVSTYDGALLWKIDDYARRKNDAVSGRQTSFYSPCFYTSRHGYKMCARIYLNGDGMGKGTHISVFFVVMRGQFDALLRWPFRQKVTIMLLDQDNVEHVIDAFRPDPNSSSFQRPRREMNVASGCPLFCALSELSGHAYVRDDVMFIKIIVDTSDL